MIFQSPRHRPTDGPAHDDATMDKSLFDDVPATLRATVDQMLAEDESLQLSLQTDMHLDGTFGQAWVGMTERRLLALSPNGEASPQRYSYRFDEIQSIEVQDLFGAGRVRVRTAEAGHTVAVFSRTLAPRFAELPRQLQPLLRGQDDGDESDGPTLEVTLRPEVPRRCSTCGAVIPRRLGVCPNCLDRRKLIARFFSHVMQHWRLVVLSVLILAVATFIGLSPPLLLRALIDRVLTPAVMADSAIEPGILGLSGRGSLALLVGLLILVAVSRNALEALRSFLMVIIGQRITFSLRGQVYHHLHALSLSFYNERQTGRIMASITQDINRLQRFLSTGLQQMVRHVLTLLIIICILFWMDAGLAALILIPTPAIIWFTLRYGRRLREAYKPLWRRWAGLSALLGDVIPGIRVVKAFAQEGREVRRFETTSQKLYEGEVNAAGIQSIFTPVMTFLTSIGTIIVWWVGGVQVLQGDANALTLGTFVAFTGYMAMFYGPVEALCRLNHSFQRAATSAERVFDVLDTTPDVADVPDAIQMPPIDGRVEFDRVTFGYEPGRPVIDDLSFTVEPGEMIGLVGHSGAGKSTLINLICRFYDVDEGAIRIDGHDLREVELASLRSQIGVVLQEPFLFTGTIAENIAYGKPDAQLDQIIGAAKAANSHDFIMEMPHGYDTILGERGARLSGGEKQRLSIARAILRDPRILILDEATASMDTETEARIQQALERLVQGRTSFAIAHRLSTLKHADRLLVIEDGKLAEIGTHEQLIAADGIYARLCRMQSELSQLRAV